MYSLDVAYSPTHSNNINRQRIKNPKKIKKIIYGSRIIKEDNNTIKITRIKTSFVKSHL
jgi:hypothetical protein